MSITANVGGVLKKLETIFVNVGGALHNLDTVYANVSGALKPIFSYASNPWVFRIQHSVSAPSGGGTNYSGYCNAVVGMDISCTETVYKGTFSSSGTFCPKTNCKMVIDYTVSHNLTIYSMSISINDVVKYSAGQNNYNNTVSITPSDKVTFLVKASSTSNLSYTSTVTLRIRLTS